MSGFIQVRYSDDGGENYSNWRNFPTIATGNFLPPLVVRRLGMTRHRIWEFMDTSDTAHDVLGASIIIE